MRKIYVFNEDKIGFGLKLKQLMKENGFTIESLADKLGFDINTIKKWRSGKRTPDIDIIHSLAILFKTSMQELYLPNSIYKGYIDNDLKNKIVKREELDFSNKQVIKAIKEYSDYLFQKLLFSFLDINEQDTLDSLFRFFEITEYGMVKLEVENSKSLFKSFFLNVKKYTEKQYGVSFPYKNNQATRLTLLKEFDKWIKPVFGGESL